MCSCLFGCGPKRIDTEFIKKKMWIYDKGFRLGNIDAINLTTSEFFTCSIDTIFRLNIPFAKIINIDKKKSQLKLKSIQNDSIGVYYDINVFNK